MLRSFTYLFFFIFFLNPSEHTVAYHSAIKSRKSVILVQDSHQIADFMTKPCSYDNLSSFGQSGFTSVALLFICMIGLEKSVHFVHLEKRVIPRIILVEKMLTVKNLEIHSVDKERVVILKNKENIIYNSLTFP